MCCLKCIWADLIQRITDEDYPLHMWHPHVSLLMVWPNMAAAKQKWESTILQSIFENDLVSRVKVEPLALWRSRWDTIRVKWSLLLWVTSSQPSRAEFELLSVTIACSCSSNICMKSSFTLCITQSKLRNNNMQYKTHGVNVHMHQLARWWTLS